MSSKSVKTAKARFLSRYELFKDLELSLDTGLAREGAQLQFSEYYPGFMSSYEAILADSTDTDPENLADFKAKFSEINNLYIQIGTVAKPDPSLDSVKREGLKAKLPFIELPNFHGELKNWLNFHDLFISLVHVRSDLSSAENNYYLRASLSGEALSVISHLPMDGDSYETALSLIKERYHNTRLLTDSYLHRIFQLPNVSETSVNIRSYFYDPLRESVQALKKLSLPVREWSYLLLFIVLQKLSPGLRQAFEQRFGKDNNKLPTFDSLLMILDEQCRLQEMMADVNPVQAIRSSKPIHQSSGGQSGPSRQVRFKPKSPPPYLRQGHARPTISQTYQTPQVQGCCDCNGNDHSLYRCQAFLWNPPGQRRSWAQQNRYCFRCLRQHYPNQCEQVSWCKHCKGQHNSLLCNQDGYKRESFRPRSPTPIRSPPRAQINQVVSRESSPPSRPRSPPSVKPIIQAQLNQPRVGDRANRAHAQFEQLRFGRQLSPEHN